MALLQASQFRAMPDRNLNFLKSSLINWLHVLHDLLSPSKSINLNKTTSYDWIYIHSFDTSIPTQSMPKGMIIKILSVDIDLLNLMDI